MEKNIWIISHANSHILTRIVTDNFMILGLLERLTIIDNLNEVPEILSSLSKLEGLKNPIVYYIFEDRKLSEATKNFCDSKEINSVDVHKLAFSFFYKTISDRINGSHNYSLNRDVNKDFITFAMEADDGKMPTAYEEADCVIIGISRTTKTPLSMYLSNHGYKVANLPLVPEVNLPDQLYKLDKNKIFALIMDPMRLLSIRRERLKTLGLPEDSIYASLDRIEDEIDYAKKVIDELGCKTIDVSTLSIEETADIIINIIKEV